MGKKETLEWCMKANLIAFRYECPRCKKNMRLQKGTVDGYEWRCRNQSKDNRHDVVRSERKGTWFSKSKLAITIILRLTRYWIGISSESGEVHQTTSLDEDHDWNLSSPFVYQSLHFASLPTRFTSSFGALFGSSPLPMSSRDGSIPQPPQ
ncbi:mitotic-spindle organizing protein 2A [Trichonephila clavipes]|nr:mitotic-spindle organizing protein 2A [Trichonephila clavipes]